MATSSDLLAQMFYQMLGFGPEDQLKKYTSKSFLLQDQSRMLNHIKQTEATYENMSFVSITFQQEPGPQMAKKVNLLPSNRVGIAALTRSIDKCMKGKFLLCRIISLPIKMSAVVVVVDDPDGELAVRFSLYNFFPSTNRNFSQLLPIGTIMAVKNPLFKTSGDGGYGLRSDNPGNVIFLNDSQCQQMFPKVMWKSKIPKKYRAEYEKAKPKTADDWKMLGNKHFAEKNYTAALNAYTSGLKMDPQSVSILSNRAATYMQTSAFALALADVNEVLKIEPSHIKAIYRKGKALCGLKKYKEALEFLSHINAEDLEEKNREEMTKLKEKTNMFLQQQEKGDYDITLMFKTSKRNNHCHFDYADYVGPIEIHEAPGKGRGVFATEDIKPGQLLIGCKAFATHFSDTSAEDLENLGIDLDGRMESYIARMITMNADKGKEFYKLYAGPELRFLDHELGDDTSLVDQTRIKHICTLNTFEPYDDARDQPAAGIWLLPSLINHSCFDCNCIWMVFGDFMLIRAFKTIPKGEEVLISYISSDHTYPRRMELFEKLGFLCECKLCILDQKDSKKIHQKRERLVQDFLLLIVGVYNCDSAIYRYYVNRIRSLRSANQELNPYLITPLMRLSISLNIEMKYIKAVEIEEKIYNMTHSTVLCDATLNATVNIITSYLLANRKDQAIKWIDTLKDCAMLVYGTTSIIDVIGNEDFFQLLKQHGLGL